jgi:hypothetical protein
MLSALMKRRTIENHELSHQHALLTHHMNEKLKAKLVLKEKKKGKEGK